MRPLSFLLGLLALGLAAWAGYLYMTDRDAPPGEALSFRDAERDLGELPNDAVVPASFRVTNASSRPIQVTGLALG